MTLRNGARRYPMEWQASVGALIDWKAFVTVNCPTCQKSRPADLEAIAAKYGREHALWDWRPKCKDTPGCNGAVMFRASVGPGTPSVALLS